MTDPTPLNPIPLEPMRPPPQTRAPRTRTAGMPGVPIPTLPGELLPTSIDGPPSTIVGEGVVCRNCSYALTGLNRSDRCPECAVPIELSLKGPMLSFAGLGYLTSIHRGICLVLIAVVLNLLLWVAYFVGHAASSVLGKGADQWITWARSTGSLIPTLMALFGYWLFTTPDPAFSLSEQPGTARRVLRITTMIQVAASLVETTGELLNIPSAPGVLSAAGHSTAQIAKAVGFVAWCVQFFAVMRYMRWLAMRVPDTDTMGRANLYSWLLPVLAVFGLPFCGIGPLVAFILYIVMLDRVRGLLRSALDNARDAHRLTAEVADRFARSASAR